MRIELKDGEVVQFKDRGPWHDIDNLTCCGTYPEFDYYEDGYVYLCCRACVTRYSLCILSVKVENIGGANRYAEGSHE